MSNIITSDVDFDIHYSKIEEEPLLKKWLSNSDVMQWFPIGSEAEMQGFAKNWIGFSRFHCSLTASHKKQPCGIATLFLMPYRKVCHLSLLYIVVDPAFQRKGVGTSLIKNLKHLAKTFFKLESLHLDVYEGCPIMSILEKEGFSKIVTQEDFVKMGGKSLARYIYEVQLT